MVIKIIFAVIAISAVSFLTRFLVALLNEAALVNRRQIRRRLAVRSTRDSSVQTRKLSRLRMADRNEIRLISVVAGRVFWRFYGLDCLRGPLCRM